MTRHARPRRGHDLRYRRYSDDETAAWPVPRAAARRRPRRRSFASVLRRALVLFLIAGIAAGVLIGIRAATFNDRVSTAPFVSTALLGPFIGSERVNVAMVGYGGADHQGPFLADSITILSIDPATGTTTTIPIPRDLWIEGVPALPGNGKVNEAFALGHANGGLDAAGELLNETLSVATGLQVSNWLAIDFAGFSEMVDAVGGVTIQNPVAFSYTTNESSARAGIFRSGTFPAGELRLDGAQALAYSRARYTDVPGESSDYARAVRQGRVLAALAGRLGDGGLAAIGPGLGLMDALENRLRTNLSAVDLLLLAGHIASDRRIELSEDVALVATRNSIGQYILIPTGWTGPGDYAPLHAFIAGQLAQPDPTPASEPGAP